MIQSLSNFKQFIDYFNNVAEPFIHKLQQIMSLKTEMLPDILRVPTNFTILVATLFIIIISFANNLVCNIIGIFYPVIYGLSVFAENPIDVQKSITLNKYWMIFGTITLIDMFFGFFLHILPFYFYLKIILIYGLVRSNFAFCGSVFSLLEFYYIKSDFRPQIENIINNIGTTEVPVYIESEHPTDTNQV